MKDCEKFRPMLVAFLDNELSSDEIHDLNQHLNRCAECRQAYEELKESSAFIEHVSFKEPTDRALDSLWKRPYTRCTRNAALLMVLGGYLMLIGYALFLFLRDDKVAAFPKFGVAGIIIGTVILIGSVVRERIRTYKHDPYKEVDR